MLFLFFLISLSFAKYYKVHRNNNVLFYIEHSNIDNIVGKLYVIGRKQLIIKKDTSLTASFTHYQYPGNKDVVAEAEETFTVEEYADDICSKPEFSSKSYGSVSITDIDSSEIENQITVIPGNTCVSGITFFSSQSGVHVFEYRKSDKTWEKTCGTAGSKQYLTIVYPFDDSTKLNRFDQDDDSAQKVTCANGIVNQLEDKKTIIGNENLFHIIGEDEWNNRHLDNNAYILSDDVSQHNDDKSFVWFCTGDQMIGYTCEEVDLKIRKTSTEMPYDENARQKIAYLCRPNEQTCNAEKDSYSDRLRFVLNFNKDKSDTLPLNVEDTIFNMKKENYYSDKFTGKKCEMKKPKLLDEKSIYEDDEGHKYYFDKSGPDSSFGSFGIRLDGSKCIQIIKNDECIKVDNTYVEYKKAMRLSNEDFGKETLVEVHFEDNQCKKAKAVVFVNQKAVYGDDMFVGNNLKVVFESVPSKEQCTGSESPFWRIECPEEEQDKHISIDGKISFNSVTGEYKFDNENLGVYKCNTCTENKEAPIHNRYQFTSCPSGSVGTSLLVVLMVLFFLFF